MFLWLALCQCLTWYQMSESSAVSVSFSSKIPFSEQGELSKACDIIVFHSCVIKTYFKSDSSERQNHNVVLLRSKALEFNERAWRQSSRFHPEKMRWL